MFTTYGIYSMMGLLAGSSFVAAPTSLPITPILASSIGLQHLICSSCKNTYSLSASLATLPLIIVLVLKDCVQVKTVFVGLSLLFAISRIGCYFASCCTGFETDEKPYIEYKGNYLINKQLKKDCVKVKPTILIEIISQFLIAFLVYNSKYGVMLFGVLNAILLASANTWRRTTRGLKTELKDDCDNFKWKRINDVKIPVISLLLASIIGYYKCGNVDYKPIAKISNLNAQHLFIVIVVGLIISNDINLDSIQKST